MSRASSGCKLSCGIRPDGLTVRGTGVAVATVAPPSKNCARPGIEYFFSTGPSGTEFATASAPAERGSWQATQPDV